MEVLLLQLVSVETDPFARHVQQEESLEQEVAARGLLSSVVDLLTLFQLAVVVLFQMLAFAKALSVAKLSVLVVAEVVVVFDPLVVELLLLCQPFEVVEVEQHLFRQALAVQVVDDVVDRFARLKPF